MGYTYRHVKTNEVINTTNKIHGKNWVPVEETQDLPEEDQMMVEDENCGEEASEAENTSEAVAEAPKKDTRRGKK